MFRTDNNYGAEAAYLKALLVGKLHEGELDTLTIHNLTERIYQLGEAYGRETASNYLKEETN